MSDPTTPKSQAELLAECYNDGAREGLESPTAPNT